MFRKSIFCACALSLSCGQALAIEAIPDEPGLSGQINLGAAYVQAESNLIAGIDFISADLGENKLSTLDDSPKSENAMLPQVNFNVKYTFPTHTQIFIGNSMEDMLTFDTNSVFGARQQFTDRSILEISALSTPSFSPVQVWKDPYVVEEKRSKTDRTSRGLRLEYDKILGTGFGVQLSNRKTELDNERSGLTQLGLPTSQANLLRREGDVQRVAAYYRFKPMGRNIFEVRLSRRNDDLDGKAMSGDLDQVQVTHAYTGERFVASTNLFLARQEFDAVNPVFNKTRDDDSLGFGVVLIDKHLFSSPHWFGQAMVAWVDQDSNIDFYDSSSTLFSLSAQYRF